MQVHGQVTPYYAGDKSNHTRKAYFVLIDGHWWFLENSDVDSDNDGDADPDPDVIDKTVYMC